MTILLMGVVFISSACLVSIPLVRLWGASSAEIRSANVRPTLVP